MRAQLAAGLAAVVVASCTSWAARGMRADADIAKLKADHAAAMQAVSIKAAEAATAAHRQAEIWQQRVADLDQTHLEELNREKAENERLRDDLRAGARRVSIAARCPAGGGGVRQAAGAAGLDDAAQRAELDPQAAGDLAAIAGDGDAAARKLTALQSYVKDVCLEGR